MPGCVTVTPVVGCVALAKTTPEAFAATPDHAPVAVLLVAAKLTAVPQIARSIPAFKFGKYPIDRVKLFIAKGDETLTTYWIAPQGATMPPLGDDAVEINAHTYKQDLAKIFAQKRRKT